MSEPKTPEEALVDARQKLIRQSFDSYEEWIKHLVTLCASGLTLTVALQNTYLPLQPKLLWLLQLCWVSLALGTLAGTAALYSRSKTSSQAAQTIHNAMQTATPAETYQQLLLSPGQRVAWHIRICQRALPWLFALALLSLTAFACINLHR
jgi:hypothetical protein